MRRCSACGAEFDESLSGCPECAADEEVHRCARCAETYSGSSWCPACGTLRAPVPCDAHPDREAHGCCVVCGRAVCQLCAGGDARVYRCETHRDVRVIEGWAQVYSTTRDFDAWLVRESLLAEGIDAHIYSQRDRTFSVELGELSIVRLLVPVWDYERAREVIHAETEEVAAPGPSCAACGEPHETGATRCSACGAPLEADPYD